MSTLQRESESEDDGADNNTDNVIDGNTSDDTIGSSANDVTDVNNTDAAGVGDPSTDNSLLNVANIGQLDNLFSGALTGCTPAASAFIAKAMHFSVRKTWLNFSSTVFGSETTSVWDNYLDSSLPLPRPVRSFAGSGEIVKGFSQHHKSIEAEKEIVALAGKTLSGSALLPAPGAVKSIPLTGAVPAATLQKRLNDKTDPMGLNYDSPATTIPGNLAGGIGEGGAPGNTVARDLDTRAVDGSLQLSLDKTGTSLTITPQLIFNAHDTVDFCPGNLGNVVAQAETVPMSILEATEARFGPVFAADVPLNVSYPGAGTPQVIAISKPTP